MLAVLSITIPIFLLIGVGFLAFRFRIVPPEHARALGAFVLNFALPALILRALSSHRVSEILNLRYLAGYAAASLLVFALVFTIARRARGRSRTESAIQAMGASVSNSGFIGYAVASLVLGEVAGLALSLNMIVENAIVLPLALGLAEAGRGEGATLAATIRGAALRLARNPLILSILVGLALALTGVVPPAPVARAIDMLANAAAAVALFSIGGALVGAHATGLVADVALIVAGKLVAFPLAVFCVFALVPGLDPVLRKAALVFASVPMIAVYPLFGQVYGLGRLAAGAMVAATALSFLTISTLLYFL
ncbi:MAG: AEC family transporter [Hyphomicrobiales bacterium]|nr:AEC family transporter [Hyphomicrobiales bacterium]